MTTFFSFWALKYMTTIDPMLNTLNYWPVGMVIISIGKWRIQFFKQSERVIFFFFLRILSIFNTHREREWGFFKKNLQWCISQKA